MNSSDSKEWKKEELKRMGKRREHAEEGVGVKGVANSEVGFGLTYRMARIGDTCLL